MPLFTQTIAQTNATGMISLAVTYSVTGTVTPHVPPDGPVTQIVATNTGPRGTVVQIWTAAQGSDPSAAPLADGSWLHTIAAPSGTRTLGPGTANQTQFGWWGVTDDSTILAMSVVPPT